VTDVVDGALRRHYAAVYRYIRRRTGDDDRAEDRERPLVLENVPRRERDFEGAVRGGITLVPGSMSGQGSEGPIGLDAARSALGQPALWAGSSIAGFRFRDAAVLKRTSAVLRRDGLWIEIEAPDEQTALAVARRLRPLPADAG
jgi:hypothetical protein